VGWELGSFRIPVPSLPLLCHQAHLSLVLVQAAFNVQALSHVWPRDWVIVDALIQRKHGQLPKASGLRPTRSFPVPVLPLNFVVTSPSSSFLLAASVVLVHNPLIVNDPDHWWVFVDSEIHKSTSINDTFRRLVLVQLDMHPFGCVVGISPFGR
jgi:hypothetical protein